MAKLAYAWNPPDMDPRNVTLRGAAVDIDPAEESTREESTREGSTLAKLSAKDREAFLFNPGCNKKHMCTKIIWCRWISDFHVLVSCWEKCLDSPIWMCEVPQAMNCKSWKSRSPR